MVQRFEGIGQHLGGLIAKRWIFGNAGDYSYIRLFYQLILKFMDQSEALGSVFTFKKSPEQPRIYQTPAALVIFTKNIK